MFINVTFATHYAQSGCKYSNKYAKRTDKVRRLRFLNRYFLQYKQFLIPGILLTIFSNFFAVYPAKIVGYALDLIVETMQIYALLGNGLLQNQYLSFTLQTIAFLSILYLAVALIKGVFMFFMRQTLIVMSRHIEYDLKNDIYKHYQTLSRSFFKRHHTGDLMTRIGEDVGKVRMYVGPALMYTVNLLVMFILVINGMLSVSPLLTLYVLLPMPFMAALIYLINSRVLKQSAGVQQKLSGLSSLAQEFFSGIRVLKSFNRTSFFSRLFSAQSEAYKNETLKLAAYDALFFPVILLLIGLSTTITLYAGGVEVMEGRLNPGVIGEFIIYVNMLTWPVASIGWVSSIIQQAAASQERINEFLHTLPEIENPANGIKAQVRGELTFESVGFTYPDTGIQALEGISFQVKQGMLLGITGSTGSGKSTLASLPGRMYDVSQGRILLDGKDIRDWDLFYLRRHIGFVPQEVVLFSDSIEENIAFGSNGKLTTDEIKEAAKKAGIYENIEDFKEKFETKIGERGVKLSGGQKQRLSIARALVSRAPILIFDDCLSAVDAETEENILNHILEASQGKTTLLISHKIGTLSRCDLIIVLQEGKMVEMGTHQELINQNGYYRKISRLQAERK